MNMGKAVQHQVFSFNNGDKKRPLSQILFALETGKFSCFMLSADFFKINVFEIPCECQTDWTHIRPN